MLQVLKYLPRMIFLGLWLIATATGNTSSFFEPVEGEANWSLQPLPMLQTAMRNGFV